MPIAEREQEFEIEVLYRGDSSEPVNKHLHRLRADIEKAVMVDQYRGGLARSTEWIGRGLWP